MRKMTLQEMKEAKGRLGDTGCTTNYEGCGMDGCCISRTCPGGAYSRACGSINWYFAVDL